MISGRIPNEVETAIRKLMAAYAGNITSVLCQFPSQQVSHVCSSYYCLLIFYFTESFCCFRKLKLLFLVVLLVSQVDSSIFQFMESHAW